MRILITGGAGFIGSHAALKLNKLKHQVLIIDNLDSYYQLRLKKSNLQKLRQRGVKFRNVDIRQTEVIKKIFKYFEPELVIHLAAKAGVRNSLLYPKEYFEVNVTGTLNILQAAKSNKVKKIMVASSSSVYGNNIKVPFSETDPIENQISPYAASKRAMEVLCKMYSKTFGLNIQIFRFFTVYGPSGRPDMAPAIFTKAIYQERPIKIFGGMESERDYTFIEDIIDGLVKAININDNYEIYNLGNNKPISLKDFIHVIEKEIGKKAILEFAPPQQGDVPKTWADISKAQSILDYNPKHSVSEGMKKFIKWYKNNKNLY